MPETTLAFAPDAASERPWSEMQGRFLNHVELVHRPGERELAKRLFALLGFQVRDLGGRWVSFGADGPGQQDLSNNTVYASEIQPEQLALVQALEQALSAPGLAPLLDAYETRRREQPQVFPHFGIRLSEAAQAEVVARIETLDDPELGGRVAVRVFRPEDPDSVAPGMIQAFVRTDIVSFATMPVGMLMELQVVSGKQAHLPVAQPAA